MFVDLVLQFYHLEVRLLLQLFCFHFLYFIAFGDELLFFRIHELFLSLNLIFHVVFSIFLQIYLRNRSTRQKVRLFRQERMWIYLTPGNSQCSINSQASFDKILRVLAYFYWVRILYFPDLDSLSDLLVCRTVEWINPIEHLVVYDPDWPYICIHSILFSIQYLWSHSQSCSKLGLGKALIFVKLLGKS